MVGVASKTKHRQIGEPEAKLVVWDEWGRRGPCHISGECLRVERASLNPAGGEGRRRRQGEKTHHETLDQSKSSPKESKTRHSSGRSASTPVAGVLLSLVTTTYRGVRELEASLQNPHLGHHVVILPNGGDGEVSGGSRKWVSSSSSVARQRGKDAFRTAGRPVSRGKPGSESIRLARSPSISRVAVPAGTVVALSLDPLALANSCPPARQDDASQRVTRLNGDGAERQNLARLRAAPGGRRVTRREGESG
ncbi:hypothetical protein DFH09DRAFT_1269360 [Mycena vulgaris]|nr:hypothetical protein DFH09DRAFT_1269360 [Mycena vulgaris]